MWLESRALFRDGDEDAEEVVTPCRRFTVREITSGLVDDSREADEWAAMRRLRELRIRVKAARAVVATTLNLAETLQRDWRKATRFYARFGITEAMFRRGIPGLEISETDSLNQVLIVIDTRSRSSADVG
jgi:hypothetical protein